MSPARVPNEAWVTLATNDTYSIGALTLGHSLRRVNTQRSKVIMITEEVSSDMRESLSQVYDAVIIVEELDSGDLERLDLMNRPELGVTFTKIQCWKLTQFTKCVFLDADTLVVAPCDEIFERDEFSAAPDAGWPDCFNSGVFVFKPSLETYRAIREFAAREGSFDGGDQGLLNMFFSEWATKDISKHLPFLYNMCATATYTYLPAYRYYGKNVKIVHFIGASKPWKIPFDPQGQPQSRLGEEHTLSHVNYWWQIYHTDIEPHLKPKLGLKGGSLGDWLWGIFGFIPNIGGSLPLLENPFKLLPKALVKPTTTMPVVTAANLLTGTGTGLPRVNPAIVQLAWEAGNPDIGGAASMDNILKKIDETMSSPGK